MPKNPPIRPRPSSSSLEPRGPQSPERLSWLNRWKREAVRALPASADAATRARLRADIGQALARYGPEHPEEEIRDIVQMIIERAKTTLEQEAQAQRRRAIVEASHRLGVVLLQGEINKLPGELVGEPGSAKRLHVLATLRDRLRARLEENLAGEEDLPRQVLTHVKELVASWFMDQNPSVDRHTVLKHGFV